MEYFVDEIPKDCIECPFCQDIKVNAGMDRLLFCKANKGKAIKNIEKSFDKCIVKNEFQSLADYTKQVRKEVCEKIRECHDEEERNIDRLVENVENLCSNDLKPMWDKWHEEMTKQIKETIKGE